MKSMITKAVITTVVLALVTGCTVGRYVTNVSSNGPNKLNIEKCTTKNWAQFYWNTECSESTVTITPPPAIAPAK